MASLDRDPAPGGPIVRGFSGRGFRIGDDEVHEAGLMLTPDTAIGWAAPALDALTGAEVSRLLDPKPEFLLLGTGPTLRRPPAAFTAAMEAYGIGVEIMDSRAAARLWGVLRNEGRQIVAALLPL